MPGLKIVGKIDLADFKKTFYSGKFVPEWNGKRIGIEFSSLEEALLTVHSFDFIESILEHYQEYLHKAEFDKLKEELSNYKTKIVRY